MITFSPNPRSQRPLPTFKTCSLDGNTREGGEGASPPLVTVAKIKGHCDKLGQRSTRSPFEGSGDLGRGRMNSQSKEDDVGG